MLAILSSIFIYFFSIWEPFEDKQESYYVLAGKNWLFDNENLISLGLTFNLVDLNFSDKSNIIRLILFERAKLTVKFMTFIINRNELNWLKDILLVEGLSMALHYK